MFEKQNVLVDSKYEQFDCAKVGASVVGDKVLISVVNPVVGELVGDLVCKSVHSS